MIDERQVEQSLSARLRVGLAAAMADCPVPVDDLTEGELARFRQVAGTPRVGSWLRGRAALKRLLTRLGEEPDTSTVSFPHPQLSLSHSGSHAVAVGVQAAGVQGIGVDLELARLPQEATARFFLTCEERQTLADLSGATLLRLWTVKEALFKADPHNRDRGLLDYRVADASADGGAACVVGDASLLIRYASLELPDGFLTVAYSGRTACELPRDDVEAG